ncbi:amino acid transporter heavy chain SLC3A1 [Bemisia tabaci]|uniref:amino acid transporter heavy chain SLC3A1 n=1 Tax=Bemisia tabaci TaxID=7038 RepID=UPI003B2847F0
MSYFVFFISSILLLNLLQETGAHKQPDWWQSSIIYQIYPLSFKDSDGDGYGDLRGIFEKLDYIEGIGVDVIWIQSFYKSPMKDLGYDVADLKSINSLFGTMEDFRELLEAIHARGMKLLLDFVPNHSSDQCEWFKLSLQGVHPYKDYYIYTKKVNDTHSTYPNNWVNFTLCCKLV